MTVIGGYDGEVSTTDLQPFDGPEKKRAVPDPLDAAAAVLHLPGRDALDRWNLLDSTAAWLRSLRSEHTRRAYYRALNAWLEYCRAAGVDPRSADRRNVDRWRSGIGGAAGNRNVHLAAVSSWYGYLIDNDLTDRNPAARAKRETVSDEGSTPGMDRGEIEAFVNAAAVALTGPRRLRDFALLATYLTTACRASEALGATIADLGYDSGHRILKVTRKGGKQVKLVIVPRVGVAIDAWLEDYAALLGYASAAELPGDLPLFGTATGKPLDPSEVRKLVKRVAEAAGIDGAKHLRTHSLRVAATGEAFETGATLDQVQDLLGHADPRTTRRYDRRRQNLDRSPSYRLAEVLAAAPESHEE